MKTLEGLAFVGLCIVAGILARPTYHAIWDFDQLVKDENARLGKSHEAANTAIAKIGSGVSETGLAIGKVQESLTDEETGTLPMLSKTVYGLAYSMSAQNGSIHSQIESLDTAMNAAVFGTPLRRGLLDTTTAISELANHSTELSDQVSDAFPHWNSRFLAVTGEGMRLLDASRRTMKQFEAATPRFLHVAQDTNDHISNIAGDFDRYVVAATIPKPWYKQTGTIGKVGMLACRLLCPQL